jgi:hypothetical protein
MRRGVEAAAILVKHHQEQIDTFSRLSTILQITTVAVLGIPCPNTGFTRFTRPADEISE